MFGLLNGSHFVCGFLLPAGPFASNHGSAKKKDGHCSLYSSAKYYSTFKVYFYSFFSLKTLIKGHKILLSFN